jgi:hypothetical protein
MAHVLAQVRRGRLAIKRKHTAWYLVHLLPGSGGEVPALDEDGILFIPRRRRLLEGLGAVS